MPNNNHSVANKMLSLPKERIMIFKGLPANNKGSVLLQLPKRIQKRLLASIPDEEVLSMLGFLDPDEITDVLQAAEEERKERIVEQLNEQVRKKVEFLLPFDPHTAAGLMSLHYICVQHHSTFDEVAQEASSHLNRTGKFPVILAVDEGILKGELLGNEFIRGKRNEKITNRLRTTPTIHYNAVKESVLKLFKSHPHDKVIVLDDDESIIGVLFSDDLLRTLEEKGGRSLTEFAGVQEEGVDESVLSKVRHRYQWLIINLATAFLAASIVSIFQETIESFVLLAVYMPIIAGMGGNTGTQTLAIMVRGIALGQLDPKKGTKAILKEMTSGLINGLIIGSIVALIAIIFNKNPLLGFIAGTSMIITLAIAGLFGALIPLVMKRLGKDPATSAAIFITTATDLFGFFTFLGLATLLL